MLMQDFLISPEIKYIALRLCLLSISTDPDDDTPTELVTSTSRAAMEPNSTVASITNQRTSTTSISLSSSGVIGGVVGGIVVAALLVMAVVVVVVLVVAHRRKKYNGKKGLTRGVYMLGRALQEVIQGGRR